MTYEYRTAIEVDVTVTFDREPYVPAQISGPVEACHPEEGGGIIDLSATWPGGTVLTEDGLRAVLGEIGMDDLECELHCHADDVDAGDDGDRRRDEMRDAALEDDWEGTRR